VSRWSIRARCARCIEPDPGLLELAGRAHGSPFLLVELLRGLQEDALVRTDCGHATLVEARLPARVTESMRERLSRLPESARQAALVASVLGRRFSFGHLSAVLNEPPSALLERVDELLRADLLTEDDGLLTYRHELIREAVRDTLPRTALRALRRQAVDALLAAGSPPVEVAAQLAASAEPGDQVAVRTLREAARALGSSDPGAAADLTGARSSSPAQGIRCAARWRLRPRCCCTPPGAPRRASPSPTMPWARCSRWSRRRRSGSALRG